MPTTIKTFQTIGNIQVSAATCGTCGGPLGSCKCTSRDTVVAVPDGTDIVPQDLAVVVATLAHPVAGQALAPSPAEPGMAPPDAQDLSTTLKR